MPNIGTIYGGSLRINPDGTGVVTSLYGFKTYTGDSSESWSFSTHSSGTKWRVYTGNIQDTVKPSTVDIIGNMVKGNSEVSNYPDPWCASVNANGTLCIGVDSSITSASDFKTLLASNNLTMCYPLATPVTYQLTASQVGQLLALNGVNNVWANTNEEITVTGWGH